MKREQIEKAAKEYRMSLPYCDDPKIRGMSVGLYDGFIKGAEWRINSVWHGVEKEPKRGVWLLVQIGNDNYDTTIMESEDNWEKLSMVMNIKRWAYVSDLMPDGKEDKV